MFYCDSVQGSSFMLDRLLFNVLCDKTRRIWVYIDLWLEWNLKGNSWELLVCKDVWNPYWLVSWNSNNHSHSDRVEWIMSWGVAGGPSLWTWSSPRREGDLPWERSGDNPLCPDSAEFGNRCRCKPPRAPMLLTQSGYRV